MDVLNQKLEAAQVAHEEHCRKLDEQVETDKLSHLDSLVSSFVSKF